MSAGADMPPPAPVARGPQAPKSRPTWMVVLSSLTLIYGGLMLVSGLTSLRDPTGLSRIPTYPVLDPEREAMLRDLVKLSAEVLGAHRRGIQVRAAGSLVVALALLYAAAAVLSRDRRGRTATLVAAWLSIVYQVGSLPLVIPMANDYAAATAPLLAKVIAADAVGKLPAGTPGKEPPSPEAMAAAVRSLFVFVPVLTALVGIGGSILLLVYYGGRRGRTLYGLPPRL